MTPDTPTRPLNESEIAARREEIECAGEAWKAHEIAGIKDEVIVSANDPAPNLTDERKLEWQHNRLMTTKP